MKDIPTIGKIVEGKIIGRGRSSLFVDLGSWKTGIIYGKEFQEAKDNIKNLKIGDTIFTKIINLENEEGYIELSVSGASKELAWEVLKEKKEKNEMIKVKISGVNKGGLLTKVCGIPAFLPLSQLSSNNYPKLEEIETTEILKELQKFIDKEIEVKIFDLDPKEKKLILSEKVREIEKIKDILKEYKPGDIVEGKITGLTDFGAFIKFPLSLKSSKSKESKEIEGLIHVSELDWQLIEDPAEIVKVNNKVKAKIIEISGSKVFLSLKALKEDPWQDIEDKYKKDDYVKGKVIKFSPFGTFIQIAPKIYGLSHISEFGTKLKMEEKLKIGESYNFQILEIKPKEHRLILKLIEEKE